MSASCAAVRSWTHRKTGTPAKSCVNAIQLLPIQEFETAFSMAIMASTIFLPKAHILFPRATRLAACEHQPTARTLRQAASAAPELAYGADQLKCLVDLCHLHGIAVIFDLSTTMPGRLRTIAVCGFTTAASGRPEQQSFLHRLRLGRRSNLRLLE